MPEEWRDSILMPIFKNKGDIQSCSNYRGIKLISHSMKLWERVVERRLRSELTFSEQQYGFMPGKSTTDALFALRVLMEKYREGQKELHCVSVDVQKAHDKLISHTMKLWERVVERRLRSELTFSEQQYGFNPKGKALQMHCLLWEC